MNDEIAFEAPDPSSGQPSEKKSLLERMATELWRLNEAQATGELAALRRMDRHSVPPTAFYRLMARAGATEMGPRFRPTLGVRRGHHGEASGCPARLRPG